MKLGFVVHWNGPLANVVGREHTRCVAYWRAVRAFHMGTKGWSDIAYSFGVCPHGELFEGRGWYKNQFANGEDVVGPDDGIDRDWYTVLAFIGEDVAAGIREHPTPEMTNRIHELVDQGRTAGFCGLRVLPHNAFKVKSCPGLELTAWAAYWDNRSMHLPEPEEVDMQTHDIKIDQAGMHEASPRHCAGFLLPIKYADVVAVEALDDTVKRVAILDANGDLLLQGPGRYLVVTHT
jgi:hypothetical protein